MMSPFTKKLLLVGIVTMAIAIPFNSLFAEIDDQSSIKSYQVTGYTAEVNHRQHK
jgi:hypothetical protein